MYRQSAEDEMVASEMDRESCNFLQRVYSLPLLNPAFGYANATYSSIKESGGLIGGVVSRAESAAFVVAKPVVNTFDYPIAIADSLACRGLSTLEEKAPIITKTPEQVAAGARKLAHDAVEPYVTKYNNAKLMGLEKVHQVRNYGYERAQLALNTSYGKLFVERCDQLMTLSDQLVDTILPPPGQGDDKEKSAPVQGNPIEKFTAVSGKVIKRTRSHVQMRINLYRQQCDALIATIANLLTTLKNTKLDAVKDSASEKLAEYHRKALLLWAELNKEEDDKDWPNKDVNEKLLTVCRVLVKRVKVTVDNLSTQLAKLSPLVEPMTRRIQEGFAQMNERIQELKLDEVPATVLNNLANGAIGLRNQLNALLDAVLKIPVLSWLVSEHVVQPFYDPAPSEPSPTPATPPPGPEPAPPTPSPTPGGPPPAHSDSDELMEMEA